MLRKEIEYLKEKIAGIPFIDTFDLRFDNRIDQPKPITQAVMFCVMDISGSMGADEKDIAKRFFYAFVSFSYKNL
jgi:uncharacterized sporulation protein YeaH/YhbH (DUF444 family)